VYVVSCPADDTLIELAPDAKPGDRYECGGRVWILTLMYGSYALEADPDPGPG
jgi:hypothetical protein